VADVAAALSPSVVQIETTTGLGSGVIYRSDGYIITAAHVVSGVERVTVRLADGTALDGEVLGATTTATWRWSRSSKPAFPPPHRQLR